MAELLEIGWSFEKISRHFARQGRKISASAISWQCLRAGADSPPAQWSRSSSTSRKPSVRGGFVVRPFTPDEDRRLLELDQQGLGPSAIGRELGRRGNSIIGRLMTLARHEARSESLES